MAEGVVEEMTIGDASTQPKERGENRLNLDFIDGDLSGLPHPNTGNTVHDLRGNVEGGQHGTNHILNKPRTSCLPPLHIHKSHRTGGYRALWCGTFLWGTYVLGQVNQPLVVEIHAKLM